jgi:hypothetical protein
MAKAYLYSLTDTWDSAGTTFNAIKMNVTDTASNAASALMELQTSGSSRFSLRKSGVGLASSEWQAPSIWATSVLYVGPSAQVGLISNGVGILEQRGGTNAQTFRLYNTYTDASNYERLTAGWSGNIFYFGTQAAGTGTGSRDIFFFTNGTNRWSISGSGGHFLAAADNTYDIGASGASRPRALYVASSVYAPYLNTTSGAGAVRAFWYSAVADVMSLGKAAGSLGGSLELTEDTAPAAPSTNSVRIYAEDNGAGKTRIMARFATGAAVQIAIEP